MSKTHLVYVPFTGMGKINRGDKWLAGRIEIFKKYVLNALCNQTNLHFTLWIGWRLEDESNPLVIDFYRSLSQIRSMSVVFTYGGLCFWDDKFSDQEAGERLYNSLRLSLPVLKQHVEEFDEVLLTIQPSDDMYLAKAFQTIQDTDFGDNKAIGWTKGYIINYATKEIAEYNPTTIPPFSTIKFDKETFLDPIKHMEWANYKSHEYVKDLGFKELEGRMFVVGTHGGNISTTFNTFKGNKLTAYEQDNVLINTGTYFTEPIIIKPTLRLIARRILRNVPFNGIIKGLYYKLNLNKYIY